MSGDDLPDAWSDATLDDLVSTKSDIVDGPFGSNLKSAHYVDEGARVVRLQNIGFGRFVPGDAFITREHFETLAKHAVVEGDLLFASLGENLPRTCLAPRFDEPAIVKADCIRVRLSDRVNPRFVLHATQRPAAKKWASDKLHGMGRPRLGLGAIRQFPVPLPPLEEQERIVEVLEEHLSRLDAALANIQAVRTKAAQFRRSLLHAAFTGGLTGEEADGQHLPAGWVMKKVGELAEGGVFTDGDWVESKDQDPDGSVRLTQLADVGEGNFRDRSDRWLRPDQADRLGVTYLEEGDLLIARMPDPLGRCCCVPELEGPAVTVVDVAVLRPPKDAINRNYLMWALNSPACRSSILAAASGTTRLRISRKRLAEIEVPVPPPSQQLVVVGALEAQLSRLDAMLAAADGVEAQCAALRRSLLHAAFTGKLTERWRETAGV